ncbi:MAG: hypothetical protein TREMPRED_005256 [Tremellales sp. Tagirdzhanova-0007]|nr:MAG: hypothetical protein TREMPRED_005256 [Tremellales sp. Tagirdzhanova-0007]
MAIQTDITSFDVEDINPALEDMVGAAKMLNNPNHSLRLLSSCLTWNDDLDINTLVITVFTISTHAVSESYWQAHQPANMTPTYPSAYYRRMQNDIPNLFDQSLRLVPPFRDVGRHSWTGVVGPTSSITVPHPYDFLGRLISPDRLGEDDPETAPDSTLDNGTTANATNGVSHETPAGSTPNQGNDTDNIPNIIGIDRDNISDESDTAAETDLAVDRVVPVYWVFSVVLDFWSPALFDTEQDPNDPSTILATLD